MRFPIPRLVVLLLVGAALGAVLGEYSHRTLAFDWWHGAIYGGVLGLVIGLISHYPRKPGRR